MTRDGAAGTVPPRHRRKLWIAASTVAAATAALLWLVFGPLPADLLDRTRYHSTTVTDRSGIVLFETLPPTGSRGEWLSADGVPLAIASATVAAEDRRFYRHHGIDPFAVARAMLRNVQSLRVVEGGSTITQQTAKLLLDDRDGRSSRSLLRKMREAAIALRMERRLSKREILALYLNLAPYGNRIRGAARASRAYFDVDLPELSNAQAAYLASLPQRPGAFNPLRDPKAAVARQREVLARMHAQRLITPAHYTAATTEVIRFRTDGARLEAQHFVERVLADARVSDRHASARIVTTLDASLQQTVRGIIAARRASLLRHGAHSVAVAVLDNASGEWLAWEGSGDYFGRSFGGAIDGVNTLRQPGSALKPFTYAVAFEQGLTPATILPDIPSSFPTAEAGVTYTPRNYDDRYRGPLMVRPALASSQNVPAVAMLSRIGPASLLRMMRLAGFSSLTRTADYYGLGLTLGDAEVTLEQLVTAYAAFARGGVRIDPVMQRGVPLTGRETRVMSERTSFWVTDILSDRDARSYAFGEGGSLDFPFPVAVKTGTSQAYRDNWAVGYTRELTVGVWVGNFDRTTLRNSSGVTGAAPIFNAVMQAAMKRARGRLPIGDQTPIVEPPQNVESVPVCALSGLLPSIACPARVEEWLPREAAGEFCAWHRADGVDWPPRFRTWARNAGYILEERPQIAAVARGVKRERLRVASPADGATYLIDPTLRREFQALRLHAVGEGRVTWRIDGRVVGAASAERAVEWPLAAGRHDVTATNAAGESDRVTIWVK